MGRGGPSGWDMRSKPSLHGACPGRAASGEGAAACKFQTLHRCPSTPPPPRQPLRPPMASRPQDSKTRPVPVSSAGPRARPGVGGRGGRWLFYLGDHRQTLLPAATLADHLPASAQGDGPGSSMLPRRALFGAGHVLPALSPASARMRWCAPVPLPARVPGAQGIRCPSSPKLPCEPRQGPTLSDSPGAPMCSLWRDCPSGSPLAGVPHR